MDRPLTASIDVTTDATPLVLTMEQAARRLGIGRTLMYELVASGEVASVTIGRLRRIPARCLAEYVDRLITASPAARSAA
jgi:excisionase family DNA binding protein